MVITKTYKEPSFCEKEILRYAGCKSADAQLLQLLRTCIEEVKGKLSYQICYLELPVVVEGETCDFSCLQVVSKDLARNLKNRDKVILFAATIGVEMDRLIGKYSRLSPTKALLMQAIGAERIEALCDVFCEELQLASRFSPGYGDLPLDTQTKIFQILACQKHIGLALTDSLLMMPSKSVTAFAGVSNHTQNDNLQHKDCTACPKTDCAFREDAI